MPHSTSSAISSMEASNGYATAPPTEMVHSPAWASAPRILHGGVAVNLAGLVDAVADDDAFLLGTLHAVGVTAHARKRGVSRGHGLVGHRHNVVELLFFTSSPRATVRSMTALSWVSME